MKIDKETRAKIMALYWGQPFTDGINIQLLSEFSFPKYNDIERCHVPVTPLYQITDEDAIEVAKIAVNAENLCLSEIVFKIHDRDDERILVSCGRLIFRLYYEEKNLFLHKIDDSDFKLSICNDSYITDYLRSRGYALPALGYSVDDLVSAGVFKLRAG